MPAAPAVVVVQGICAAVKCEIFNCLGAGILVANVDKNIKQKSDNYLPLTAELKRLYIEYDFEILPVVIGATGLVTKRTFDVFKTLGIRDVEDTILKCQKSALTGTMKIVKSFMKM